MDREYLRPNPGTPVLLLQVGSGQSLLCLVQMESLFHASHSVPGLSLSFPENCRGHSFQTQGSDKL